MKKRLLASVLALALVLSLLAMPAGKAEAKTEYGLGYIMPEEVKNMTIEERAALVGGTVYTAEPQNFPETFDLREYGLVSPVKNQGAFGTCWAHAACAAMESNALMMGYGEYDLSEYQLSYCAFYAPEDPSLLFGGDVTEKIFKSGKKLGDGESEGGNSYISAAMVMKGYAPASEEKYPYKNIKKKIAPEAYGDCVLRGNSTMFVSTSDYNSIKAAITKFGAMSISVCGAAAQTESKTFNVKNAAAYIPADMYGKNGVSIDHEVAVVGWDDNFSKDNFNTTPDGDGAWLIKNSWGEDWGLDGYYWLSYYDAAIAEAGAWTTFTVSPAETYDYQYQYDGGLGLYGMADALEVAMAFSAKADQTMTGVRINTDGDAETGVWTPITATVNVYKGIASPDKIEGAKAVYTQTTLVTEPGYQTIEFKKGLNISEGERIFVVVSFDHAVYYQCDGPFEWAWYRNAAVANEGETFMRVARDGKWYDHGIEGGDADEDPANSVCLKAMVRNGHNQDVIRHDPNAIQLDEPTFYLLNNEEAKVTVTWKAVEGAEGYNIYRKIKGQEDDFSLLATVDANASKYYDTGLTLGTDYIYKVVPFVGSVEGSSAEKTIRATIAAPWITKLENNKKGQVKITIQNVKGAKSYSAYRLIGKTYQYLGNTTKTTYVDTFKKGKYEKGVTYTYKLAVKRGDRTSALSAAKTITTTK